MRESQQLAQQIVLDVSRVLCTHLDSDAALLESLKVMCQHLRCRTAAYWRFDDKTEKLNCEGFHTSEECSGFERVTRQAEFGIGTGLPGRTCEQKSPVWIYDIVKDLNFPRAEQAEKFGFHTAFAFPIIFCDKAIGVFEFFTHERTNPDDDLINAFVVVGAELGQFFARLRFERELLQQSQITEYAAEIGTALNQIDPLPVLLQRCTELTVRHLKVARVEICVQNDSTNRLECVASSSTTTSEAEDGDGVAEELRIPLIWDGKPMGEIAIFSTSQISTYAKSAMPRVANNFALCIMRKKTEQQLQLAERRFREFAHAVDEVFFVSSPTLTEHFYVSEAFEKVWELPISKVMEQADAWLQAVIPEHQERLRDYLRRLGETEMPESEIEYAITTPEGRLKWLSARVFRIIDEQGTIFSCGTVRDITERKQVETRLGEFYTMVSHELRTPLTSIKGAFILLERGKGGSLSERAEQIVQLGQRECDRLIRLINDMLDIKRIEAGKLALYPEQLDPAAVTMQTIEMLTAFAAERGIKLDHKIEDCSNIVADRDRVIQVITNLLSNAVKFSPAGETVTVTVEQKGGVVRFSVTDHGVGISKQHQEELFKVFQRIPYQDGGSKDGAGLGLAISKGIVTEHGGRIGVISDLGKGAQFWFELPVKSPLNNR